MHKDLATLIKKHTKMVQATDKKTRDVTKSDLEEKAIKLGKTLRGEVCLGHHWFRTPLSLGQVLPVLINATSFIYYSLPSCMQQKSKNSLKAMRQSRRDYWKHKKRFVLFFPLSLTHSLSTSLPPSLSHSLTPPPPALVLFLSQDKSQLGAIAECEEPSPSSHL